MEAMQRLVRALVESPDTILQELVNAAVELCGADSAGISMEKPGGSESDFYHWIATAGVYSDFCDAAAQSQRLRDMSGAWWSTALSGGSGIFQYS